MTTLLQVLAENKHLESSDPLAFSQHFGNCTLDSITLTDTDLACLAAHAQQGIEDLKHTEVSYTKNMKRALSLMREAADLMLRERTLHKARVAAWTSKDPSPADLTQDPKKSNVPISKEGLITQRS
jgi:hypothetical protein